MLKICDIYKETPLHKANAEGCGSTIQLLWDKGAVTNACYKYNWIFLHKANKLGHKNVVQLSLDNKADFISFDLRGETQVIKLMKMNMMSLLTILRNTAYVYFCDKRETPFIIASKKVVKYTYIQVWLFKKLF